MTAPLLAIDLGTTTGWALLTPEGSSISGARSLKPGCFTDGAWVRWPSGNADVPLVAHEFGGRGINYWRTVRRFHNGTVEVCGRLLPQGLPRLPHQHVQPVLRAPACRWGQGIHGVHLQRHAARVELKGNP